MKTTDVGFTFAGNETEAASTKICIPNAEFPQGISVNVVLNDSTPLLTGSHGHVSPVWSPTTATTVSTVTHLETLPSLCNSSDRTSCFGKDAEQQRTGTAFSVESSPLDRQRAQTHIHKRGRLVEIVGCA